MNATVRRLYVLAATTLGMVAATAAPASAGLFLSNHCPPSAVAFTRSPSAIGR